MQTYDEIAKALYGDGAWEITKAEKNKRSTAENLALAGNAASTVAGPAAMYSAYRAARTNSGGIPRTVASGIGPKLAGSSVPRLRHLGESINRGVSSFNTPKGRKMRIAAGVAGAATVGLQGVNVATDALSTKLLAEKKKEPVHKAALKPLASLAGAAGKATGVVKPIGPKAPTAAVPKLRGPVAPRQAGVIRKNESDFTFGITGTISKANDKKQVFGWASVVEINGEPVVDLQGDYATIDVIEKAVYDYVDGSRKGGDMHTRAGDDVLKKSHMIESFVVTPEKKQMLGLPESMPIGWWVGYQVNDDDLWEKVRKGERPQFSIHGSGRRVEVGNG